MKKPDLRIGTSGWNYGDWRGVFYPEELRSKDYLRFYATQFTTVEVNYSFYHLPRPSTYENWSGQVPDDFVFAVKASRFVTHIKRLGEVEEAWQKFLENASVLGNKLGPILFQLPPSFKMNPTALSGFLEMHRSLRGSRGVKLAFEFRHQTWFDDEVFKILRKYRAALVIAQSKRYPQAPVVATAPFVYLRFHGPDQLFASPHSYAQLKEWSSHVKSFVAEGKSAYIYFNNDVDGFAIENARTLAELAGA